MSRIRNIAGRRMRLATGKRLNDSDPSCCCGGCCPAICSEASESITVSIACTNLPTPRWCRIGGHVFAGASPDNTSKPGLIENIDVSGDYELPCVSPCRWLDSFVILNVTNGLADVDFIITIEVIVANVGENVLRRLVAITPSLSINHTPCSPGGISGVFLNNPYGASPFTGAFETNEKVLAGWPDYTSLNQQELGAPCNLADSVSVYNKDEDITNFGSFSNSEIIDISAVPCTDAIYATDLPNDSTPPYPWVEHETFCPVVQNLSSTGPTCTANNGNYYVSNTCGGGYGTIADVVTGTALDSRVFALEFTDMLVSVSATV